MSKQSHGVQGVVSSNPTVPTSKTKGLQFLTVNPFSLALHFTITKFKLMCGTRYHIVLRKCCIVSFAGHNLFGFARQSPYFEAFEETLPRPNLREISTFK